MGRGVTSKKVAIEPELATVGPRFWQVTAIGLLIILLLGVYRLFFGGTSFAKLEELQELIHESCGELLLVDHALSPRQQKNLEDALKIRNAIGDIGSTGSTRSACTLAAASLTSGSRTSGAMGAGIDGLAVGVQFKVEIDGVVDRAGQTSL